MTEHCRDCGSRLCAHGHCPQCDPCTHCDGGDIHDKFFGYDDPEERARYSEDSMKDVKTGLDSSNDPDTW